ncbi:MAG: sulfite oxidase heme-binding subunit YedZ [Beijerinckiaceae bacterium]
MRAETHISSTNLKLPWKDRAGRLSWLKLAVFTACFGPALWLVLQAFNGWLGSKPLTEAIHQSGDWAVRFLLISLAITPLRTLAGWPQLIVLRRMLGLASLAYVLLHVVLYTALEAFDLGKVVSEIVLRIYLTIGFVALLGLLALGLTSTDGMIRRLGVVSWNRLHSIVYAIAILSLVHFALQRKLDVSQPMLMAGFFLWLMGYRALRNYGLDARTLALMALAVGVAIGTALIEAAWYATMTGAMAERVLLANLNFEYTIRPAWWVFAAGLAMVGLHLARRRASTGRGRNRASPLDPAVSSATSQ